MIKVTLQKKTKSAGQKSATYYLVWWERHPDTGKMRQRRKSTGCTRKDAAEVVRQAKVAQLENELAGIDTAKEELQKLSFTEVKTAFLEVVKAEKRPATHAQYKKSLDQLAKLCSPAKVNGINQLMLQDFKIKRLKKVKKVSVDQDLRAIRRFLNWAADLGYIDQAIKVKLYNDAKDEPPVQIPRSDIRAMITKLEAGEIPLTHFSSSSWVMAIRLLHYLGCRRHEFFELKWSAVDLERGTVTIHRSITKSDRTGILVLSPDMIKRLKNWKRLRRPESDDELVLPRKVAVRTLYDEWVVIRDTCGLPGVRWKDLRSTCGSELAQQFPLSTVQSHLRHSSPAVTKKFYINDAAALRSAADQHEPL